MRTDGRVQRPEQQHRSQPRTHSTSFDATKTSIGKLCGATGGSSVATAAAAVATVAAGRMQASRLGRLQPMQVLPRCSTVGFSNQHRHLMCKRAPQRTALAAAATAAKDKGRRPLLDLVVSKTKQFVEQQQGRSISSEDALVLLEEQQLLAQPELYCFLNQELRHVQVVNMLWP